MHIADKGLALIKAHEGCRLAAYLCPSGKWTIGYGHTAGVTQGMTITHAQADSFLEQDVEKFEKLVEKYNGKYNWNQNEFDALVSNRRLSRAISADYFRRKHLSQSAVNEAKAHYIGCHRRLSRAYFSSAMAGLK